MDTNKLNRLCAEALGTASMCWSEVPKGVFESDHCKALCDKLVESIVAEVRRQRAEESRALRADLDGVRRAIRNAECALGEGTELIATMAFDATGAAVSKLTDICSMELRESMRAPSTTLRAFDAGGKEVARAVVASGPHYGDNGVVTSGEEVQQQQQNAQAPLAVWKRAFQQELTTVIRNGARISDLPQRAPDCTAKALLALGFSPVNHRNDGPRESISEFLQAVNTALEAYGWRPRVLSVVVSDGHDELIVKPPQLNLACDELRGGFTLREACAELGFELDVDTGRVTKVTSVAAAQASAERGLSQAYNTGPLSGDVTYMASDGSDAVRRRLFPGSGLIV